MFNKIFYFVGCLFSNFYVCSVHLTNNFHNMKQMKKDLKVCFLIIFYFNSIIILKHIFMIKANLLFCISFHFIHKNEIS